VKRSDRPVPGAARPNPESPPHWEVQTDPLGGVTAVLTGTYPPLTVTADDIEDLRKKVRIVVMRGML
jgi:hypothetical protein